MRLAARRLLARLPHAAVWYRAIRPQFLQTALAFSQTAIIPGRFNSGTAADPSFPVLYLTEDPQTALYEVEAMLGSTLPGQAAVANPQAGAWVVVPVRVQLHSVADLCDETQLRLLDTSVQELTGDWRGYQFRPHNPTRPPVAPTQRLGTALARLRGLEGFLTYSARASVRRNLVLFPTKLRPRSRVELIDPATGQVSLRLP
jgi:RES domain-containing protein